MNTSQNHYAKKIIQKQKVTYYMIPFVGHYGKANSMNRKLSRHQGLAKRRAKYKGQLGVGGNLAGELDGIHAKILKDSTLEIIKYYQGN